MSVSSIRLRAVRAFLLGLAAIALLACGEVKNDDGSGNDDDDTPPTMDARNGEPCTVADQCESAMCVDGVCCDAACDGACESCALADSLGTCAAVPAGDDPADECAGDGETCGGTCDGARACAFPAQGVACGTCSACDGAGQCAPVAAASDPHDDCGLCSTCDGSGACAPQTAAQDLDDECADEGACGLNGSCDGAGACAYYDTDTVHTAQRCDATANATSLADMCDGAGGVSDGGTVDCTPYVCDGAACGTTCVDTSDCAPGYFCDTGDVDGDFATDECLPQRDDGDTCTADDRDVECRGGECSNGFCCSDVGGTCCGVVDDCPAPPPTCLNAATCFGQRTVPNCVAHACDPTVLADDTACADQVCAAGSCGGLIWTPTSTCDASGACTVNGTVENCNDADVCTTDTCHPLAGCQHAAATGNACNDGNACTLDDVCTDGVCGGTAKTCNDDNVCTDDVCNGATGACEFPPTSGGPCDDANPCTETDTCADGACRGAPLDCNDDNVCTTDGCDVATGACTYEAVACTPGFTYQVLLANDSSLAAEVYGFADDVTTPALNNNSLVVVQARDVEGLPVIVVADTDGAKPLVTYADFPSVNWPALPSLNDSAEIAFVTVADGVSVVRVNTDGSFTTIAAYNDPTPGGGQFANFNGGGTAYTSPAILDDGTVVFWAAFRNALGTNLNGVFAGAAPDTLAQLVTGPTNNFYARIGASGGDYVVRKLLAPGSVLHGVLSSGDLPLVLDSVASLRSGPSVNAEGLVAYVANDAAGVRGVFRSDSLVPVANAEQGYANMLNPHINLSGHIAFEAAYVGDPGVYLWDEGSTRPVAQAGDTLADGVIKNVRFYRGLNDAGEVAFWTRLEDGREAIVLAVPTCLGAPCDDGEVCTVNDACDGDTCKGTIAVGCP